MEFKLLLPAETALTLPEWPLKTPTLLASVVSHSATVWSPEAVSSLVSPPVQAASKMAFLWQNHCARGSAGRGGRRASSSSSSSS